MKSLVQYITEDAAAQVRKDVIALQNERIDWKEYIKAKQSDQMQAWLVKSIPAKPEWNSVCIFIPYDDKWYAELRLRFDELPKSFISVIGHWSEKETEVKLPTDLFLKELNNFYYYNSIISSDPQKYNYKGHPQYAKYLKNKSK